MGDKTTMAKRIVPLSELQVSRAKAKEKEGKLFDGGGLFLLVTPAGGKLWRLKYRFDGKERKLSLGSYPEVSLSAAREKRLEARKLLAAGVDPGAVRKSQQGATAGAECGSFEVVAREWHARFRGVWSPSHGVTVLRRLELDVFPVVGARPVGEVVAPELLAVLRRIESRGALETAHRVRTVCSQVFRYAVATGRAERDPTADLRGALPAYKKSHLAAVTDPKEAGSLLRAIDGYQGSMVVRCALQLAALVFVRPGELRLAIWSEIDLDAGEWTIPAERMKMKVAHLVPLSRQAVAILRELQPLTGRGRFVFPCHRSTTRAMSNNAVNAALRRMGFDKETMTGHGFRAMARTILDEVLDFRPDIIEHQLAHAVRDPNGRAYNRTSHLAKRREMMQIWADYLDGLKV